MKSQPTDYRLEACVTQNYVNRSRNPTLAQLFQRSPKKNRPKADFFEGKLFSEKSGTKIWGEKGRRLTEGFSI